MPSGVPIPYHPSVLISLNSKAIKVKGPKAQSCMIMLLLLLLLLMCRSVANDHGILLVSHLDSPLCYCLVVVSGSRDLLLPARPLV